jgi:hypothetical protein
MSHPNSYRSSHGLIAAFTAATSAACTGLLGFDDVRLAPRDSAAAVCAHRVPPARPAVAGRGGTLDLVFAASALDLGDNVDQAGAPRYRSLGFDLDTTCTGEGEGPSCIEPPWANSTYYADGVEGIDNAIGELNYQAAWPKSVPVPSDMTRRHDTLLRIRGYSGDADDDQVEVSAYVGLDVAPRDVPLWDGGDRWRIHRGTLVPLGDGGTPTVDRPKVRDDGAYVSNYVLVARFPEMALDLGADTAPDYLGRYEQVVVTARLVQVEPGKWELHEGISSGRRKLNDVLMEWSLGSSATSPGQPICNFPSEYDVLKRGVCSFLDIASGPDSPASPCDALSGAAGFEAKQALLGDVGGEPQAPPPCDPHIHPDTDSCEIGADQ